MIYAFDDFELDLDRFELRKGGVRVAIEPQVFALIQLLVENHDRMVPKQELMDVVWDGRIVSEAAVSSRIRSARSALGDNGKTQKLIRTVHGQGLRFMAGVARVSAGTKLTVSRGSDGRSDNIRIKPDENPGEGSYRTNPSVAVLPFSTYNSDSDEPLFAAGLTEEIIAYLARFRDLFVFSRSTTSTLTRDGVDIGQLRNELDVDFVVDGSVRIANGRVRAAFHLIDAATGGNILVDKYERACTPEGIYDIQDRMALLIAGRVADRSGPLVHSIPKLSRKGRSSNWETYLSMSRFYSYYATRDTTQYDTVNRQLQEALISDPGSSDCWAALAILRVDEYRLPYHRTAKPELLDDALASAKKAAKRDPENGFAQLALALTHFHRREKVDFELAAQRAIALNPGHAHTLAEIAYCYCLVSEFAKSLPLADKAIELSPIHPGWFRFPRACNYLMEGEPRAAIREQKKTPIFDYFWYQAYMVAYCGTLGDETTTTAEVAKMQEMYPDFSERVFVEAERWCVAGSMPLKMLKGWRLAGLVVQEPDDFDTRKATSWWSEQ